MHCGEARETLEIGAIECKQARDSMDLQHGRQMSIVNLNAAHAAGD
jgi:hypothetical protein